MTSRPRAQENDGPVPRCNDVALLPAEMAGAPLTFSECAADSNTANIEAPEPAALSDDALIRAVRRGDAHVGALLYQRLIRITDATLTRVLGPGDPDHDDCVQATFEEVVRSLHRGRFQQRCQLTSWAASVACHVGLNAIRSRRTERGVFDRTGDLEEAASSQPVADPERALEARDELRQVRAALATLSAGRAEALLLHDAMGYAVAEVAALTDSSETAVLSRLTRGRRDLLQRLGMVGAPEEDEA